MKSFISVAALAAGASAAALHVRQSSSSCCFGLTVSGGIESGSLGQLSDGQNRVGPGFGGASYCLSGTTITDSTGKACVIAQPQEQFQCDLNGVPTAGFSVTSNGELAFQGNTTFFECAATADYQFNIYTAPTGVDCAAITLTTNGITGTCAATTSSCSAVTSTTTQVSVSTATVTASVVTTAPGVTVYETSTLPAASCAASTFTETETAAASTVYVTVSGAANTISEVSTATVTVSGAGSTVTQVSTITESATITAYVTVTGAGQTVVETQTAEETISQTAPGTTIVETVSATPYTSVAITSVVITPTPTPTPSTSSSSTSTASATSSACAADLSGSYQYPHLIIPVSSTSPNTAYGTQYNGTVSPTVSTIFNFDIPSSYSGETCSLIFLLPLISELETSSYSLTGSGEIEFLELSSAATQSTTYNNAPSTEANLGTFNIQPGSSTVIATTACAAGETVTYELKSTGTYDLEYFQDYNPSPLGLYVRAC